MFPTKPLSLVVRLPVAHAQDCSRNYGGSIVINRGTRLTPPAFEEEVASHPRPDPAGRCPDGLHSLSAAGDLTLVDAKRHELLPAVVTPPVNRLERWRGRMPFRHGQDRLRQSAA